VSDVRGSSNDTSGAYHDSIMGSKNVAYSRESARFRFEMVFDNGEVVVDDDDDDDDVTAVAVVVVRGFGEEEEEAEDVDAARAVGGGENGALLPPLPAPPPRKNALASPPHSDANSRAATKGRWVDSVFLEGFLLYTSGFFSFPPLSLSLFLPLILSFPAGWW